MIRKISTAILGVFMLGVTLNCAYGFGIDKLKMIIPVGAGETYEGEIVVSNEKPFPVALKVHLEDFEYTDPTGGKQAYPAGTLPFSLSGIMEFSSKELVLTPNDKQVVKFTITPGNDFTSPKAGVLFFEALAGELGDATYGAGINVRVGSLIIINPASGRQSMSLTANGGSYSISGEIIDDGETFLELAGSYYILDKEGLPVDRGEMRAVSLFPKDKARLEIELSKELVPDQYTAIVTYDVNKGEDVIVKEIEFSLKSSGDVEVMKISEQ